MNDKEYEQQKKRVRRFFDKWRQPLGMGWWKIQLLYEREPKRGSPDPVEHLISLNGIWDCVFETRSDWYYATASICCFLPIIKDLKDEDLERYLIHELIHIHLAAMRHNDLKKEEELVATKLADAFLWTAEEFSKKKRKHG